MRIESILQARAAGRGRGVRTGGEGKEDASLGDWGRREKTEAWEGAAEGGAGEGGRGLAREGVAAAEGRSIGIALCVGCTMIEDRTSTVNGFAATKSGGWRGKAAVGGTARTAADSGAGGASMRCISRGAGSGVPATARPKGPTAPGGHFY